MITLEGISVSDGITFGKIAYFKRDKKQVKPNHAEDSKAELLRFETAKSTAIRQLKNLYDKACAEVGEAHAMIFDVHQMMLADSDYNDSVSDIISHQQVNAEYAVAVTADNFTAMFDAMEDDYMKARKADVRDVSERVLAILSGNEQVGLSFDEPVILATDDLAPSETISMDKGKILSFITIGGSANSHTAILARMMNIPAVVGLGKTLGERLDGKEAIVDGFSGCVYIEPDVQTIAKMKEKADADAEKRRLLVQLRGKENRTLDGKTIDIFANIGSVADVVAALQNDAGGIGLFRSEFLYLQTDNYPTEEEQFQAYKLVAENMACKKVIIRTLDIGADKQIDYFNLPAEENPALGFRAIRICLERPEIFKTQLRALYRASVFGNIAIMFPMIISVEEVIAIKKIITAVHNELDMANIPYSKDVECGIMIETPASVMISDILAKEVDFFSVGTNDLTQYTLALDRQNQQLERFHNAHHPAILRMIQMAADNAHKEGKWIGICGELAADLELTETFIRMGIDELSVSPPYILPLRERVRSIKTKFNLPMTLPIDSGGKPMQTLPKTQRIYAFSKTNPPAITINSGDKLTFQTHDALEGQITNEHTPFDGLDWSRVNPATGPVYVNNAEIGDILAVEIHQINIAAHGIALCGKGLGVMGEKLDNYAIKSIPIEGGFAIFSPTIKLPLNKMIGVIGTAPAGEPIPCGVPDLHGGNMDCKEIREGATVYLPVNVPGGLLALGDLHAVMADGEIGVTGLEVAGEVVATIHLIKAATFAHPTAALPIISNESHIMTVASHEDLDVAVEMAVENMVKLLEKQGFNAYDATMLISLAGDVRICQVVDPKKTVRVALPREFANVPLPPPKI